MHVKFPLCAGALTRPAASSESIKKHKVNLRRTLQSTAGQWQWLARGEGYCTARPTRYEIDSDGVGYRRRRQHHQQISFKRKRKEFLFRNEGGLECFFFLSFSPSHPPCFFFSVCCAYRDVFHLEEEEKEEI